METIKAISKKQFIESLYKKESYFVDTFLTDLDFKVEFLAQKFESFRLNYLEDLTENNYRKLTNKTLNSLKFLRLNNDAIYTQIDGTKRKCFSYLDKYFIIQTRCKKRFPDGIKEKYNYMVYLKGKEV